LLNTNSPQTLEHRRAWGKQVEIAPDGDEEEEVGDGRGRGEGRRRGRKVEAESALVRHPRPRLWRGVCGREEEAESVERQPADEPRQRGLGPVPSAERSTKDEVEDEPCKAGVHPLRRLLHFCGEVD
jgi:hypothetical protein